MAGRARRTPKKAADWRRFLDALAECGTVSAACDAVNIGRRTAYDHRKADDAFAGEWDEVLERVTDELEQAAIARAKDGSDTLLIFLLKNRRAEYAERREVTHVGAPVKVSVSLDARAREALSDVLRGRPASSG